MHPDEHPETVHMLAEEVVSIVAETCLIDREKITLDSTFEELGVTSLDGVNIMFELENKFDIDIPDEGARDIATVGELVEKLGALLGNGHPDEPETGRVRG